MNALNDSDQSQRGADKMDFRTLQYFVTVAEELNFTRAAEKLQMSQPPLSNSIRQLEEDLGTQLFIRGKRRLTLTEAGELLLRRSRQILRLSDKTRLDLQSLGSTLTGQISIGMVEGHAPYYTGQWITDFSREHTQVHYELRNGSGDEILSQLERGLIDIAVIARPYDHERYEGITIGREPWTAIMPKDHRLAKMPGDTIPLRELAGVPLFVPSRASRQQSILRWFADADTEPTIIGSLSNYLDAVALAEAGGAVTIFPATSVGNSTMPNGHIVSKVITDPPKYAEYVLVWKKDEPPRGAALAFTNYVEAEIARQDGSATGLRDSRIETDAGML